MRTGLARKWPVLALATALLGGAAPSHASAAGTVDAQCTIGASAGSVYFSFGGQAAQTFTASKSGKVLTAEVTGIYRPAGDGADVTVAIYAAGPGGLAASPLTTATIPGASIPTDATITLTADFPTATAAYLDAGQQYAVWLSTLDNMTNTWAISADSCPGNLYSDNNHNSEFVSAPGFDAGFKVYLGPANDDFARPQALAGAGAVADGTTAGGTTEAGEPDHYVTNPPDSDFWIGDHSVWYRWKAPGAGFTVMNTCTAAIDSILAVYTGTSIDTLTRIADNNNSEIPNGCAAETYGSILTFDAVAGTAYRVAVGDAGGLREDTFTLDINGAANELPTITGLAPAHRSKTRKRRPRIKATLSDSATDLAKPAIQLYLDGVGKSAFAYDPVTDRLSFKPPRKLRFGRHRAELFVTDEHGGTTTERWWFRVRHPRR